ncbi:MAG: methyltransferase family protein [Promethearchaeota archaeon]
MILGFFWPIWANIDLFTKGKGSPIPTKSTQTIFLAVSGPYRYCRNPMIFGTFLIFAGLGIFVNSLSLLLIIAPIILILLCLYVKLREEQALEGRFGAPYLEYKNLTSFVIPWFPSDSNQN